MNPFILPSRITKEYLLSKISQQDIFEKFLGVPVEYKGLICNPLRVDNNPTCSFKISNQGNIRFTDYSGYFKGDCFELVQFMYNLNYPEALEKIASVFKLSSSTEEIKFEKEAIFKPIKTKADFKFNFRKWTKQDLRFWGEYGITQSVLKYFQIYPIQDFFLNGEWFYSHNNSDLAYCYWFGEDDFKVYFPNRKKKENNIAMRFLCNTQKIQGWNQLPEKGDTLIITKALKDVCCFYQFGIPSIAPQAESCFIDEETMTELFKRFSNIYSWYDFDLGGIRGANKLKRAYNIKPIFLTNGRFRSKNYGSKDPSDLIKTLLINQHENI